jgi:hypothetical protein
LDGMLERDMIRVAIPHGRMNPLVDRADQRA